MPIRARTTRIHGSRCSSGGRTRAPGVLPVRAERAAGPGWAALPFTAGFVDPLHSTGIAHTLAGIERLAYVFEREDTAPSSDALNAYSDTVRRELDFVDALVASCYAALPSFQAPFTHDFLCADDEMLQQIAQQAVRRLRDGPSSATDYAQFIEEAVQPYNRVGLFDPPVANMYPHTAAPV